MKFPKQRDIVIRQSIPKFDPTTISGLRMWLDPTRNVTVTSGHVTSWADTQGAAATFTNTGTDILAGSSLNGRASVDLNTGAGGSFLSDGSPLSSLFSASAWTFLAVWKYTGGAAENAASYLNSLIFGSVGTYLQFTISATNLDATQFDTAYRKEQVAVGSGVHYAVVRYDGTKIRTALDGAAFDVGTAAGNVGNISDTSLFIGDTRQAGAAKFAGSLGDLMSFNVAVSDSVAAALGGYVRGKYGL